MTKLLASGASDLLEGFVSNKTRRKFKARLEWDAKEGKVVFAFEPRPDRRPAAKASAARSAPRDVAPANVEPAVKTVTGKKRTADTAAKTTTTGRAKKTAAASAAAKKAASGSH
jgi:DNA topoisomerase-3